MDGKYVLWPFIAVFLLVVIKGIVDNRRPFQTENAAAQTKMTEHHPPLPFAPCLADNASNTNSSTGCCYEFPLHKLSEKFTPEYFEIQRKKYISDVAKWTGNEYQDWRAIYSTLLQKQNNLVAVLSGGNITCHAQWWQFVLNEVNGFYLKQVLKNYDRNPSFRYISHQHGTPKILELGDSLSRGIWVESQRMFGAGSKNPMAAIQGAPTNMEEFRSIKIDWWSIGWVHVPGMWYNAVLGYIITGRIWKHTSKAWRRLFIGSVVIPLRLKWSLL
jgi:hypothetical protein